jgi:hypothetical protein
MVDLVQKGIKYFSGKQNYKSAIKEILESISANKSFANDVSKIMDVKRGLDRGTSDSIIKMPIVQSEIEKVINKSKGELDKTELENQLKNILVKSWSDLSDKALDKVKKDIK